MAEPTEDVKTESQISQPSRSDRLAAWSWIPTLYFTSGMPYVVVATLSAVMYKNMGVSNADVTAYTSDLLWPWVIKPFWSPLVDLIGTQRRWTVAMQALIAIGLLVTAWFIPTGNFLVGTLASFWILAIASATHDIAADGFYMVSMNERDQAWFVGIRSSFWRLAMIVGSGVLVFLVGMLNTSWDGASYGLGLVEFNLPIEKAWYYVFTGLSAFFAVVAIYHQLMLPRPATVHKASLKSVGDLSRQFLLTFGTFFQKKGIILSLAYLLVYRFSEAQLAKMKALFLLDPTVEGGLGLTNQQLGILDGTIGVILLTLGGIVGGIIVARDGLRRWIFPMAIAINLPNAAYAYLAWAQPDSIWQIGTAVAIEQFGYGFGFAGYMLYMLYLARGEHQTAHYAICTGFMTLGYMLPGRFSGAIQESVGYENFFLWVLIATIPSLIVTLLAPLQDESTSLNTAA